MGLIFNKNVLNQYSNPFNRKLSNKEKYDLLDEYYENNELYDSIQNYAYQQGLWVESMKPLRNPVHRSVEFFASKLLPGEVRVVAKTDSVKSAIEQFHKWSNLQSQKAVLNRQLSLYGDMYY